MRAIMSRLLMALDTDDDTRAAGAALGPALDTMISELHPDSVGGALLLGVKGVGSKASEKEIRMAYKKAALRWHPRVYVSGPLAELELGPSARNISGARRAAERLVAAARLEAVPAVRMPS